MEWKVKLTETLYKELQEYLFSNAPKENGCFLLASNKKKTMYISEIYYPEDDTYLGRDEEECIPHPKYISKACIKANQKGKTLLFIHTHPREEHPSSFSYIDEISNKRMFENLDSILKKPMGSLVMSQRGIHGVIYVNKKQHKIDTYSIYGETISIIKDVFSGNQDFDKNEFDRQLRFLKYSGQNTLSDLNIAIVGLGGTGSPLAVMLAKMGIKNLAFYDFDKLEIHNIPRIYGATKSDIGKYKIDVVANHIKSFSDCEIILFPKEVDLKSNFEKYDFIFGCVDNHTARDILNTIVVRYAIPYIDTGTSIPIDENGNVKQSVISVNTVLPTKACLWCLNTLDGVRIMEESMNENERAERMKDGYLQGVEKTPSIITLTTAVSTFAINRMLTLLNILPGKHVVKMMFDFSGNMLVHPRTHQNSECKCNTSHPFH